MVEYTIIVDTREQLPLWTKNVINKKLDVGDYSINGHEDKISIERKSLSDLFGTLGTGHKRFKKELERALKLIYFAIVIDGSYSSCINKEFNGSHHTTMKGEDITSIIMTIHMKYKVPIFFTNGRIESKNIIRSLLTTYYKLYNKVELLYPNFSS